MNASVALKNSYGESLAALVQNKCVILSVEFSKVGTNRRVDSNKIEVDADKNRYHAIKSILESKNVDQIDKIWGQAYGWLMKKCLPAPMRKGLHLLPVDFISEVYAKMDGYRTEAKPFVTALCDELPQLKDQDRAALRDLFDESDYPTTSEIYAAYTIELDFLDLRVSDKLPNEIYKSEVNKDAERWDESAKNVRQFLRETLAVMLNRFVDRLGVETEGKRKGKPKIFKDSLLVNIEQFLTDFDARNVTEDAELTAIVEKARNLLSTVDAETLRENDKLRKKVKSEVQAALGEVEILTGRAVREIKL